MGQRKQDTRSRSWEREDLLRVPVGGTKTIDAARGANVSDHLLQLQRSYGNAAVTTVVVQRRPKQDPNRPQSTDVKDVIPYKEPPAREDFFPKGHLGSLGRFPDELLPRMAKHRSDGPNAVEWRKAATIFEEIWFRTQQRAVAFNIAREYRKAGDTLREAFWSDYLHKKIDPGRLR